MYYLSYTPLKKMILTKQKIIYVFKIYILFICYANLVVKLRKNSLNNTVKSIFFI